MSAEATQWPEAGPVHWMVWALRRAGLIESPPVGLDEDLDPPEAWEAVRDAAGIDDGAMAQAVADYFRTTVADLDDAEATAAQLLPASVARRLLVFPVADLNRTLKVATCDPSDPVAEREIGFASGRRPDFVVAPPAALRAAIEEAYEPDRAVEEILGRMGDLDRVSLEVLEETDEDMDDIEADLESGPAVKLANLILHEAITQRASDIHIQPSNAGGLVRFRVDGVLRTALQFPHAVMTRVLSRIKVMGRMDIADRLRPQDGRAQVLDEGRRYDLRISSVPVRGSEKVVVRILDSGAVVALEETRLPEEDLALLRTLLGHRDGVVVVTGPTGSGKTTTLYGSLMELSTDAVNIMTVEDPVEYELPGLAQIQVEPKKGVTFASALKAILRQDPDVIFVGEIRDRETAEIAAQASLTGHLVLATVHANDAVGAIRRLTDLGLDASTVVQTLRGALAQRLLRRVCPDCAEAVGETLTAEEEDLAARFGTRPTVRATGCSSCQQQGYRGRLPVAEILEVTPWVEALVLQGAPLSEIEARARREGMRCLREAAIARVEAGETTLEEVQRVLGDVGRAARRVEGFGTPGTPALLEHSSVATADDPDDDTASGARRVLLVDDEPVGRAVARALLERDRFEVDEAEDGQEAVDVLARNPDYSLVVLDLDMPRMSGEEALKVIRSTPATASLPVLVLTGRAGAESEAALLREGADDYLNKPIDAIRFTARVQAALRRVRG